MENTQSTRSEEHTSELQSHLNLVCRLLLEKKHYLIHIYHIFRLGDGVGLIRRVQRTRALCQLVECVCVCVCLCVCVCACMFFFFNDTAPTEIYSLSLHDALPI